jgi:hypothetical protein
MKNRRPPKAAPRKFSDTRRRKKSNGQSGAQGRQHPGGFPGRKAGVAELQGEASKVRRGLAWVWGWPQPTTKRPKTPEWFSAVLGRVQAPRPANLGPLGRLCDDAVSVAPSDFRSGSWTFRLHLSIISCACRCVRAARSAWAMSFVGS